MNDDAFAAAPRTVAAPYDPRQNTALPTSAVNQNSGGFWGGIKGMFKAKVKPPQATGPKTAVRQGVWAAAKPHQLAPAAPKQLGSGGVMGDGDSTPLYSSYASNDWQRKAMFSPPPPTSHQFPQAAYNSFDQLENWPDASHALDAYTGQSVAAVVMKN